MTEVEKVLNDFGKEVVRQSKLNIGASRIVDGKRRRIDNSGALRKSVSYEIEDKTAIFNMLAYGFFVDSGRDGTKKKNRGKGLIEEGNKGKGMPIKKLNDWIKTKPVRLRDLTTGGFIKTTESGLKQLSFLINRKIREKGITARLFFSEPFNNLFPKLPDKVAEAHAQDIEDIINELLL